MALKFLKRVFPDKLFGYFGYQKQKNKFLNNLRKLTLGKVVRISDGPCQSEDLALATSSMRQEGVKHWSSRNTYFRFAYGTGNLYLKALQSAGFNFPSNASILDFGCGSARLLRLFRGAPDFRLVGTDMNPTCVDWCRKNISNAEFHLNQINPPLAFAKDNEFDLVVSWSVFTHIALSDQRNWLNEIYRVLKPGGIFLCSIAGSSLSNSQLKEEQLLTLNREGSFSLENKDDNLSLSSQVTNQHDVFQSKEEVKRVFGSVFDLVSHIEWVQDLLVLKKPMNSNK